MGEMSRSISERVKEHGKEGNSEIYIHYSDHLHPLSSLNNFTTIGQESSEDRQKAKKQHKFKN